MQVIKIIMIQSMAFKGSLIEPGDCERFGQMFPCVSKNMNTGPHSDRCLQDLWQNAGCITRFSNPDVGPVQKQDGILQVIKIHKTVCIL